ncbi:MAG: hypothetical protein R3C58_14650 [Parvularculaceae bacterium]
MSAVTTLAASIAAAAGAVALYRFLDRRSRPIRDALAELRRAGRSQPNAGVIDYEQDPVSGVYRPKEPGPR